MKEEGGEEAIFVVIRLKCGGGGGGWGCLLLSICRGVGVGNEGSRLEAWMKSRKSEVAIT